MQLASNKSMLLRSNLSLSYMKKSQILWSWVALIIISLNQSYTYASDATSQIMQLKIQTGVEKVRALKEFPQLQDQSLIQFFKSTPEPISPEIKSLFLKLENKIFGKNIFRIGSYDGDDLSIFIDKRIINVSPKFEKAAREKLPQAGPLSYESMMGFLLAHEMAHFIYEVHVKISPEHLSPLGNVFYVGNHKLTVQEAGKLHGEVDVIALYLLKTAGINYEGAPQFLDQLYMLAGVQPFGEDYDERPDRNAMMAAYLK